MSSIIYLYKNSEFNKRLEAYYFEKQCSLTRSKLTEYFCEFDLEVCSECVVPKYYPKAKRGLIEFLLS